MLRGGVCANSCSSQSGDSGAAACVARKLNIGEGLGTQHEGLDSVLSTRVCVARKLSACTTRVRKGSALSTLGKNGYDDIVLTLFDYLS